MVTKQWIVKDFEDGSRGIGDCLELGFEANERVLSDPPDASGGGILSCSVSDLLRGQYNRVKNILRRVHGIVLNIARVPRNIVVKCHWMRQCKSGRLQYRQQAQMANGKRTTGWYKKRKHIHWTSQRMIRLINCLHDRIVPVSTPK
jgi:hypothetical protein